MLLPALNAASYVAFAASSTHFSMFPATAETLDKTDSKAVGYEEWLPLNMGAYTVFEHEAFHYKE